MRVLAAGALAAMIAAVPLGARAHDRGMHRQSQGDEQGQGTDQGQQGYGKGMHHASGHAREIQQGLKDAGYDPGPIDGVMGKKTKDALKQFQQAQNLPATGRLDSKTMAALHVGGGSATSGAGAAGHHGQSQRGTESGSGDEEMRGTQGGDQGMRGTQGSGAGPQGGAGMPGNQGGDEQK